MKSIACPNEQCLLFRIPAAGNIIKHGFCQTRWESIVDTDAALAERHSAQIRNALRIISSCFAAITISSGLIGY
jgi:hypothetical protein